MIQAWIFVCLLNDLSSETLEKLLNDPNNSEKGSLDEKQSLSSAISALTFLKWIGGGCLAVWIVLYLLPNFATFFPLQSPVAFRLWILLPQLGVFLMMILLAVFSRPVTKLIGLLKGFGADPSPGSPLLKSQDAEVQGDAMRPIVWALLGLVLVSLVSQAVAQRWLAPKYLEKQIASSKTTIEDMKSRPQNGSQVPTPSGRPSISIMNQQGLFEQVARRYYNEGLSIFPMLAVYTLGVVLSLLHLRRLGKSARFALVGCVMFWLITILNPAIQEYYLSQWRASGTDVKQLSSFSSPYNLGRVSLQCIAFSFMLAAVFYRPAARIENQSNPIGEL